MAVKLNNSDEYEELNRGIFHFYTAIKLSKERTPKAFQAKVEELLEEKVCSTNEEAEKLVNEMLFELELYYHKGYGLFAVESDAVESGTIYSPYSGELCEKADET
jgi:hypothetical protein